MEKILVILFKRCSSYENWNISNGVNFSYIFLGCSSLSFIKALQNWNVSNGKVLEICSMDAFHY